MTETVAAKLTSVDRSTRRCTVRAYSGAAVQRRDASGQYELSIVAEGMNTDRAAIGTMPLLLDHKDDSGSQVGRVARVWRQGPEILAELEFGTSTLALQIFEDVAAGIRRAVSIGLAIITVAEQPNETTGLRRMTVTQSELIEISIVPIPADGAAVVLAFSTGDQMNSLSTTQPSAETTAERTRAAEILRLGNETKTQTLASAAIQVGTSVADFRAQVVDHWAAEGDRTAIRSQWGFGEDSTDKLRLGLEDAIYSRATGKTPSDAGRPYVSMSMLDMSRTYLRNGFGLRDSEIPSDPLRLSGAALGLVKLSGLHSTSDFPNILGNVASRVLQERYLAAPAALKVICRKRQAQDFRTLSLVRLGEHPQLEQVNQAGEFKYGTMAEGKEAYSVKTYGKIIGLTRQAIINDDLGAFDALPSGAAQAAVDLEARTLVALLAANAGAGPTMNDGLSLFHASHGNLAASGAVIADNTLAAAKLAMRSQKGVDGVTSIDVTPGFLIVPAALENIATKFLATITPNATASVNAFSGTLQLIVEPRLDAVSATRWYLASDHGLHSSLEYAYLAGAEGPHVETRIGFEVDGLEMKVRLDFGAGAINHRGIYANPGA